MVRPYFPWDVRPWNFNLESDPSNTQVIETDAFEALLGTDFMEIYEHFFRLLVRPSRLVIDGDEIPITDYTALFAIHKVFRLKTSDESYHLVPALRRRILTEISITPKRVRSDCFSNKSNHQKMRTLPRIFFLWRYNFADLLTSDQDYLWSNPPFSKMAEFVTKWALIPCKIVVIHPNWYDAYWASYYARCAYLGTRSHLVEPSGYVIAQKRRWRHFSGTPKSYTLIHPKIGLRHHSLIPN